MSHRSWPGTLQARGLWPGHRGPTLARGPGRCLADHTAQPRGPGRRDVEVTESQVRLGAAAGTRTQQLRPLSAWLTSPPGTCEPQERNSGGGLSALGRVGAGLALSPGGRCTLAPGHTLHTAGVPPCRGGRPSTLHPHNGLSSGREKNWVPTHAAAWTNLEHTMPVKGARHRRPLT